ncbi:hypothetical protein [Clostridium sp. D33t1_170424_F3]|uniref:hypothetical protein n=1 Tax=Clostridium sp. D33t1_170424_F3 TaxID=2787099 RepID=UPI0018ABA55F|nr:hypothetical protein [Clostridium sp. D33t1_170424_F3]
MALGEKSFFWDKPEGALTEDELAYYQYAAQDLASFFECLYTTGIAPQMAITSPDDNPADYIGSSLAVTAGVNLQVIVSPGAAMIKGRGYISSFPMSHTVSAGATTDIVLRLDLRGAKPQIYVATKQREGNVSIENSLLHDALNYELALATVVVPQSSTAVTAPMITDQRLNTSAHPIDGKPLSGLMKSIPNVDTKGIWEQNQVLQDYFKTTFNDWFETAKSVLSEDAAGQLLNMITALQDGKANKSTTRTTTLYASTWSGSSAPYTYNLSVSGVTATSNQDLLPGLSITAAQLEALQAANIQDGGQTSGRLTLKAWGDKPTINIPVRVIVRGDA